MSARTLRYAGVVSIAVGAVALVRLLVLPLSSRLSAVGPLAELGLSVWAVSLLLRLTANARARHLLWASLAALVVALPLPLLAYAGSRMFREGAPPTVQVLLLMALGTLPRLFQLVSVVLCAVALRQASLASSRTTWAGVAAGAVGVMAVAFSAATLYQAVVGEGFPTSMLVSNAAGIAAVLLVAVFWISLGRTLRSAAITTAAPAADEPETTATKGSVAVEQWDRAERQDVD